MFFPKQRLIMYIFGLGDRPPSRGEKLLGERSSLTRPQDLVQFEEAQGSARGSVDHTSTGLGRYEVSPAVVESVAAIGGKNVDRKYPSMGVGDRSAMFFRVVETSRVDGKTRVTVESEDSSVKLLLQFLGVASEFGYAFQYRADADLKSHDREKDRIDTESERKAHHAHVLTLWRSMKGMKPSDKVHRIQETMRLQGREYRYSEVESIVSVAIQDEKVEKARSEGATGSTVVQRKGRNARVPTRVLSPQPDHRVRLVGAADLRAHRREAGSGDTARRHDARNAPSPPPRIVPSTECATLRTGQTRGGQR